MPTIHIFKFYFLEPLSAIKHFSASFELEKTQLTIQSVGIAKSGCGGKYPIYVTVRQKNGKPNKKLD